MKPIRQILVWACITLQTLHANAQAVSVNATVGLPAADYFTLKQAFDAINNGVHQGSISILINASTTETATAMLNASGGLSSYSSINIQPSTVCAISGNIAGPLINFNGADAVTIDGRIGGVGNTRSLTIQNTYSGVSTTSSYTLYFMNGANYNMVRYCIIEGLGQTNIDNAAVYFYVGNSGNTIDNNEIRPVGNGWLFRGICGADYITNNLIHDFSGAGSGGNGVPAGIYYGGVITGNSLYHTDSIFSSSGFCYIYGGALVSKNFIGGTAPNASGNPAYFSGNFFSTGIESVGAVDSNTITNIKINSSNPYGGFTGINGYSGFVGPGPAFSYSGNTIGSLNDTSAITVIGGSVTGIAAYGSGSISSVNIQGNKIGGLTATEGITGVRIDNLDSASIKNNIVGGTTPGNIKLQSSATGELTGIFITSTDNADINCSGNTIRNLTATGNVWVSGIYNSSQYNGPASKRRLLNNSIYQLSGSSAVGDVTVNGIYSGTSSATGIGIDNIIRLNDIHDLEIPLGGPGSAIAGIRNESSGSSFLTIDSNQIHNISSAAANTTSVLAAAVQGIGFFNPNNIPVTISNNVISNLTSNSSAATCVAGINAQYNSDSNQITIDANKITNLKKDYSVGGSVSGMMVSGATGGTFLIANNMISLSPDSITVYGINNNLGASSINVRNNSIYLGGIASGNNSSAAFSRIFYAYTPVALQNNIFQNFRSGGTGGHYALMNPYSNPIAGWVYSNYNDLYSANPNTIALWGSNSLSFSDYQSASTQDGCSISDTVDFVNGPAGNLHLLNTTHNHILTGLGNASVTTDFDGNARHPFPAMGADELTLAYQGVAIVGFGSFCSGDSAILNASVPTGIQWYRNGTTIAGAITDTLIVTQAGTYYAVLPNGCLTDTSNLITVGLSTINDTVVRNGFTLTSLQPSAIWQWIDCNTNLPIPGATAQSFTPLVDGYYAVIISYNGCVDTSDCSLVTLGVPSLNAISASIFPNPGSDRLTVLSATFLRSSTITLTNFFGQIVKRIDNLTGSSFEIDAKELRAGIYLIEIKDGERSCRLKWLKAL